MGSKKDKSQAKPSITKEVELPDGIEAKIDGKKITVKGPKGETSRVFSAMNVSIAINDKKIVISEEKSTKREKKLIGTFAAHVRNMIKGVQEGHYYELKVCSSHFPMNVALNGNEFAVKNFIGEKIPRKLKIDESVKVSVQGTQVKVEGVEKDKVAQTAANIERLTKRPGFDKRIFQDGIYIVNKDGKMIK